MYSSRFSTFFYLNNNKFFYYQQYRSNFKHENIKKKIENRNSVFPLSNLKFSKTRSLPRPTFYFYFTISRCSIFSPLFPLLSLVYTAPHRKVAKKDKELEMQRNGWCI